ncbi:hypothetical protein KKB55_02720 [Myxococcota bacterium]|nr:hypothetical protein [Myxococcota bacterium]MBU1896664.1 hypothetical protein [Myxococcota bacterium]
MSRYTQCLICLFFLAQGCEDLSFYPRSNPLDPMSPAYTGPVDDAQIDRIDAAPDVHDQGVVLDVEIIEMGVGQDSSTVVVDANFECVVGHYDTQSCILASGSSGGQERLCLEGGFWSSWTQCHNDECQPNDILRETCRELGPNGHPQIRIKNCLHNYVWGPWSDCYSCDSDKIELRDCGGGCGTQVWRCPGPGLDWNILECELNGANECFENQRSEQVCPCGDFSFRTCDLSSVNDSDVECKWSDFSLCSQAECTPGERLDYSCLSACGVESSISIECLPSCIWPDQECPESTRICVPGEEEVERCGACNLGERKKTCAESGCEWNYSECVEDDELIECNPRIDLGNCPCNLQERLCQDDCTWSDCPRECTSYQCLEGQAFMLDADPDCEYSPPLEVPNPADNLFLMCRSALGGKIILTPSMPTRCQGQAGVSPDNVCADLQARDVSCGWLECCPDQAVSGDGFEVLAEITCNGVNQVVPIEARRLAGLDTVYLVAYSPGASLARVKGCVAYGVGNAVDAPPLPPGE